MMSGNGEDEEDEKHEILQLKGIISCRLFIYWPPILRKILSRHLFGWAAVQKVKNIFCSIIC
jgi:hypothetical protein